MSKSCNSCGCDVTDAPRVKDNQGRYFCETCVKKIKAKRAKDRPKAPPGQSSSKSANQSSRAGDGEVNLAALAALESSTPTHEDPELACPSCKRTLPESAEVCIACGYSKKKGKKLSTKRPKGKKGGGLLSWLKGKKG